MDLKTARKVIAKHNKVKQDREEAKYLKRNKALVGTYWKYHNSYSDGDKWWLYIKILGVVNGSTVNTLEIEKTSHDNTEIKHTTKSLYHYGMDGYTKIDQDEWKKGIVRLVADITEVMD